MSTRIQKGYIFRKGEAWFVRFYDSVMEPSGSIVRKQVCRKLVDYSDRYRSRKSVRGLADEVLKPLNSGRFRPESTATVVQFIEQYYLPHVAEYKRPSTLHGYQDIWKNHLRPRLGEITLRDFRCSDGERLLSELARQRQYKLARRTLHHVKSFLSGVFKFAKRQGILDGINPMQDVSIPRGREPEDTYAYSLEEIERMLHELPEPARAIAATAAFTGLRKGEIRGLNREDYNGSELRVSRSVWGKHVSNPKTSRSAAPVPVIPLLAQMLDVQCAGPSTGPIFRAGNGQPLNLDNLARRVIAPVLAMSGLKWHGWHAFRRGLATNLHRLAVPDKVIQAILRHANVTTTANIYIKTVSADAVDAMNRLESAMLDRQNTSRPN